MDLRFYLSHFFVLVVLGHGAWRCLLIAAAPILRVIAVILALLLPSLAFSGYDEGKAALARNDIDAAAREFSAAARAGHASAQYALGLLYARGLGVARSDVEAANWFLRAAEQNHGYAQYNIGLMRLLGGRGESNRKEAFKWLRAAANAGIAQAQADLGTLHFHGDYKDIEYPEAVMWLGKAADQGHAFAQNNLGLAYLGGGVTAWKGYGGGPLSLASGVNGTLFPKNEREAALWFRKAAEQNVVLAQFNIGFLYEKGMGVDRDHAEAIKWYSRAIAADFTPAFMNLAVLVESGTGVPHDPAKGLQLRMRSTRSSYHRVQEAPIVVWYFGIQAFRHLDAKEISSDLRKLSGGSSDKFLMFPDLLVDSDLQFGATTTESEPVSIAIAGDSDFTAQLCARIARFLILPTTRESVDVRARIHLAPDGNVLSIDMKSTAVNKSYASAIERAALKAQPFNMTVNAGTCATGGCSIDVDWRDESLSCNARSTTVGKL